LADEQFLGVRYSKINTGTESFAVLAVKSDYLTNDALDTPASMIAIRLIEILRETQAR
jgi:hypothetical protein